MKIVMAGTNPVQLTRGMEATSASSSMSSRTSPRRLPTRSLPTSRLSPRRHMEVGMMISDAMAKVGRKGVITLEEAKSVDNNLIVVGVQFDRGYIPYFVTDSERMTCDYDNCKLVDKKIKSARDMITILEEAIKSGFPLLIIAEDIERGPRHPRGEQAPWR